MGLIILVVIFLVVGLAYSYFKANLKGIETDTTINLESGSMRIVYEGGSKIEVMDFAPSNEPLAVKNFTITGNSTINNAVLGYKISLIIDENTFSEDAISYTLESANIAGNGEVIPSILEHQAINNEDILLGTGYFTGIISNSVHSYKLKFYFLDIEENNIQDIDKYFEVHILVENNRI